VRVSTDAARLDRAKLRLALDMAVAGREMARLALQRRYPGESEEKIDARFRAWLDARPMDADGIVKRFPQPSSR
jgi:Rv0078B-related antitoxin